MATSLRFSQRPPKETTVASNTITPEPTEAMIQAARNDYALRLNLYTQQQLKRIKSKQKNPENRCNDSAKYNGLSKSPNHILSISGVIQRQHVQKQKRQIL
ncbi:7911_t:CDS:1 [Acaulospora colombiana]|uniref:7911_t:CDS:1 n=1 Tax=Acaulospora colombiana TaxID=27376 RepID=A0ACA9JZH1_9GLOM|nr:7911_t:CDS:1 [Acaulospora colombiana]